MPGSIVMVDKRICVCPCDESPERAETTTNVRAATATYGREAVAISSRVVAMACSAAQRAATEMPASGHDRRTFWQRYSCGNHRAHEDEESSLGKLSIVEMGADRVVSTDREFEMVGELAQLLVRLVGCLIVGFASLASIHVLEIEQLIFACGSMTCKSGMMCEKVLLAMVDDIGRRDNLVQRVNHVTYKVHQVVIDPLQWTRNVVADTPHTCEQSVAIHIACTFLAR